MPVPNIIKIDNLELPELKVYTTTSEVQLLRANEPDPGVFIAESPKVIERALDAGYVPISFLAEIEYLRMYADDPNPEKHPHAAQIMHVIQRAEEIPVYTAEKKVLEELTGFHLTSGMVCAMKRRRLPSIEEVCRGAMKIVLLEDITNPTNVGAIFRCAAALNMDAVLLTKDCSDPLYRRAIRVGMGTAFQIPWTVFGKHPAYPQGAMDRLHTMGYKIAAMVLSDDAVSIDDKQLNQEEKLAIVLGNEDEGLLEDTVAASDYRVCIPMSHGVDSLNVAAASALAFWQLGRK